MTDRDVYERLREIVPSKKVAEMDIDDIEKACYTAFDAIGYSPKDFSHSFKYAWEQPVPTMLFQFIFSVYMEDSK